MVEVAQLEAPLDITRMAAALEAVYEVDDPQAPPVSVSVMTVEELTEAARAPGYQPRRKTCTTCTGWDVCWHRRAEDRLKAVQQAQKATRPGEIPVVSVQVGKLAGGLLPSGVHVAHLGRFSNQVEAVYVGDYLALRVPLPGVVYDQDGHAQVIAKDTRDGIVSLTLARTNSPGAEPTTHHYPARCIVTAQRAVAVAA